MLPVSVTAILIRIIFKLKLADIVITVTSGGPGGATDTVTSFIFREYRERSNVGYGTMLAMVYLVLIVIAMTVADEIRQPPDDPGLTRDMTDTPVQIFRDSDTDRGFRMKWWASRTADLRRAASSGR
jgi:hypothetical protein